MPSAKELAKALAYQGEIRNQPRNRFLGGVADFLAPVSEFADRDKLPGSIPLLGGMSFADLSGLKGTESLVRDMSHGKSPVRGATLNTVKVDPRLLDLAAVSGAMIPVGKALGKAALREGARQIETGTGVLGRNVIDPRMNIVSPEVANKINMPVTLPNSSDFISAVKGTKGAEITPDGLKMNLVRFQKPEQELEQSVRNGVFYLPEGNPNVKHYKNKGTLATGNPYGGNQKISGETLYKNPLFVKGATGGKAPEAAYKQLFGNDMFNKMTEEARSAASAPRHMKEEVAYKFLEDYAPELSDSAWNIVQNSNQGNQLRYALQEAVIGNSARQKGYDGILGYSKGRGDKGNFLSEVFDLRESHYPSPDGTSYLNDYFEELLGDGRAMSAPDNVGGAMMQRPKTEFEILHDTAQRNAALPVEQGGLGLPEGNTGMDRAAAMDWNTPAYHGSGEELRVINNEKLKRNAYGKGLHSASDPELANIFANHSSQGQNVSPLLLRVGNQASKEDYKNAMNQVWDEGGHDATKIRQLLIDKGFDTVTYNHGDFHYPQGAGLVKSLPNQDLSYATLNPSQVRSRFAAFDPMRRHEADILAGVGVGGMLDPQAIAEALRQQDRK